MFVENQLNLRLANEKAGAAQPKSSERDWTWPWFAVDVETARSSLLGVAEAVAAAIAVDHYNSDGAAIVAEASVPEILTGFRRSRGADFAVNEKAAKFDYDSKMLNRQVYFVGTA